MIPYGRQEITGQDIASVTEVLKSNFLTQGPKVPEFEQAVVRYCGVKHAIAVNSGTSALHIACLALGVQKGDLVWTSPITFVASANCARFCGADIDFVDIDAKTYNLSPTALKTKLEQAEKKGRLPKVVIPVHLCGQSCEMSAIRKLADQYGFAIIEDACHAIGGKYEGKPVGNCRFSDITVFSFHPVKIITTAEGGMATTNSDELAAAMRLAAGHGITRDREEFMEPPDGAWSYQQIALGYNYRMTDIQAALGISQLRRLDQYVATRHKIAEYYREKLQDLPISLPWQHPDAYSSFHIFVIRIDDCSSADHKKIFDRLRAKEIGVNIHYIPVHLQPYYKQLGFRRGDFPEAEQYYNEAITLPLFPALNRQDQDFIIRSVEEIFQ